MKNNKMLQEEAFIHANLCFAKSSAKPGRSRPPTPSSWSHCTHARKCAPVSIPRGGSSTPEFLAPMKSARFLKCLGHDTPRCLSPVCNAQRAARRDQPAGVPVAARLAGATEGASATRGLHASHGIKRKERLHLRFRDRFKALPCPHVL